MASPNFRIGMTSTEALVEIIRVNLQRGSPDFKGEFRCTARGRSARNSAERLSCRMGPCPFSLFGRERISGYDRPLDMTKTEEFTELLRTHGDTAWRMALHLTKGNESDARDLVQEGFVRIWRYWGFQKPDHFKSWMYRILHNLFLDECRRRKRRHQVSLDEPMGGDEDALSWEDRLKETQPDPEQSSETQEKQRLVRQALQRLPTEFRIPVALCDMEGLSYDEIARIVSCPVGTVRSRIHRGRVQLRAALGHLNDPEEKREERAEKDGGDR